MKIVKFSASFRDRTDLIVEDAQVSMLELETEQGVFRIGQSHDGALLVTAERTPAGHPAAQLVVLPEVGNRIKVSIQ